MQFLSEIMADWRAAPHGQKSGIVKKWAVAIGCSPQTLYRQLNIGRIRTGEYQIADIELHVQTIAEIKKRPPDHAGELSWDQARIIAENERLVPPGLCDSTLARVARKMGLNKRQRRVSRFQADFANQLHHVDASSSKFFYIHRQTDDGDYILRVHAGVKGYKNKPVPIRLRPWIYGLTDDYSGVHVARYIAAYGENARDNLEFLEWAWSQNDDKPFFGLPKQIKGDLGPMMRGEDIIDFFDRLGIIIDPSTPMNKDAHGKIERPWRTTWQRFEKPYFAEDWRKFEIPLSELNRRFYIYQSDDLNARKHRYEKKYTRIEIWEKSVIEQGGAVAIPDNAIQTFVRRRIRTVRADGTFSINNVQYEVKGLHTAEVEVIFGEFDNRMVVRDLKTKIKYEVEEFKPNALGEFKAAPHTPHQKAKKAAEQLNIGNSLYNKVAEPQNITKLPTRIRKTQTVDNPLEVSVYASLSDAMADFISVYGYPLDQENRIGIGELIMENNLERKFTKDLALELRGEMERRKHG